MTRNFFQCTGVKKWARRREAWYSSKNSFFFLWHKLWTVELVGSKKTDCHPDCPGNFGFWQRGWESFPAGESWGNHSAWEKAWKALACVGKRALLCKRASLEGLAQLVPLLHEVTLGISRLKGVLLGGFLQAFLNVLTFSWGKVIKICYFKPII